MRHLSEVTLQRLLDGNLSFVQKILFTRHLSKCDECSGKLEQVRRSREELLKVGQMLEKLQDAETELTRSSLSH